MAAETWVLANSFGRFQPDVFDQDMMLTLLGLVSLLIAMWIFPHMALVRGRERTARIVAAAMFGLGVPLSIGVAMLPMSEDCGTGVKSAAWPDNDPCHERGERRVDAATGFGAVAVLGGLGAAASAAGIVLARRRQGEHVGQ